MLGESVASEGGGKENTQTELQQGTMDQFFQYRQGLTHGPMRFCCAAECHKQGMNPPKHPVLEKPKVNDLNDMLSWATDNHDTIEKLMPSGALQLVAKHLRDRSYSTAFSGIDCPGTVSLLNSRVKFQNSLQGHRFASFLQICFPPKCIYCTSVVSEKPVLNPVVFILALFGGIIYKAMIAMAADLEHRFQVDKATDLQHPQHLSAVESFLAKISGVRTFT